MKKYSHIIGTFLMCLAMFLGVYLGRAWHRYSAKKNHTPTLTTITFVFNTTAKITLGGKDLRAVADEITASLQDLHNTINIYDPASELSKLNATADTTPFHCSDRLWDILQDARKAHALTNGLFDISVGPLLKTWGFHTKRQEFPSEQTIQENLAKVGLSKVIFDDTARTVSFPVKGMSLDLGGIAKGYALKIAIDIAKKHHVDTYHFDFGGNLGLFDTNSAQPHPYLVGIKNPRNPEEIGATITARNACIATSGNYERAITINGKIIGHIMDPRTGRPVAPPENYDSATVSTPDPTLSDVLSTTAFAGGFEEAKRLADLLPGTTFTFITVDKDGELTTTTIPQK